VGEVQPVSNLDSRFGRSPSPALKRGLGSALPSCSADGLGAGRPMRLRRRVGLPRALARTAVLPNAWQRAVITIVKMSWHTEMLDLFYRREAAYLQEGVGCRSPPLNEAFSFCQGGGRRKLHPRIAPAQQEGQKAHTSPHQRHSWRCPHQD